MRWLRISFFATPIEPVFLVSLGLLGQAREGRPVRSHERMYIRSVDRPLSIVDQISAIEERPEDFGDR